MAEQTKLRIGFRGKRQLPLLMIWREIRDECGRVTFAYVIFNSLDWIGL